MSEITDMSEAVSELDDSLSEGLELIDDLVVAEPDTGYRSPWDRRDDETDTAWELFSHYRDQGPKRTVAGTARHAHENHLGNKDLKTFDKYRNSVRRYSETKHWSERVFAYDVEQERIYQLARSEAIREMAVRHEVQIEKAINGLMLPIDALTMAMADDPEFVESLSSFDKKKLIQLANLAARTIPSLMAAERLSRGMPTEIVSGVVEHQHVTSVDRDQIGEILAVLGQAGVLDVAGTDIESGNIVDAEVVEVHSVSAEDNE